VLSRWPLPLAFLILLAVPASAADQSVTASGTSFSPDSVTVDPGDTVTWSNGGGAHNVNFDDGSFNEPPSPDFSSWTVQRTFDTPGTFRYHCELHGAPNGGGMSGVVRVRDATGEVPEPVEVPPGLTARARDEQGLKRLVGRKGVRVRTRCVNGCDVRLKLSLAPKTAARFGFARRRKTIGTERADLATNRTERLDVGLTRKAKKRLAGAERSFKVRLDVTATKDTRETARETVKIIP
jgi:plastocyanin